MLTLVCPLLAKFASALSREIIPRVWMGWFHGVAFYTGLSPNTILVGFCLKVFAVAIWSFSCAFAIRYVSPKSVNRSSLIFLLLSLAFVAHSSRLAVALLLLNVLLPAAAGFFTKSRSWSTGVGLLFALNVIAGVGSIWVSGWNQAAMANWGVGSHPLDVMQMLQRPDVWRGSFENYLVPMALAIPVLYLLLSTILVERSKQMG